MTRMSDFIAEVLLTLWVLCRNAIAWFKQLGIAVDQVINVLATPFHPGAFADETMSSRVWRMDRNGKPWGRILRPVIDALLFFDRDHCRTSYESEKLRSQLPPEFR